MGSKAPWPWVVPLDAPMTEEGLRAEAEFNELTLRETSCPVAIERRTDVLRELVDTHVRMYPRGVTGHPRNRTFTTNGEGA